MLNAANAYAKRRNQMSASARVAFRRLIRKSALTVCAILTGLILALSANAQTIVAIDAPGAGVGAGHGTQGFGITPAGVIMGDYIDANGTFHGFVRASDGAVTPFDVTGAGTGPGQGTVPNGMNPEGVITGYYTDSSGLSHGFVRSPGGAITTFDAPGAGIPVGQPCTPPVICSNGTQGASINPAGAIAGQFVDPGGVFHGFL